MDREMKKQFWKEVRMTKYEYPHARMRMEDWFTVFTSPEELRAAKLETWRNLQFLPVLFGD